jgi:hypothetical protein
MPVPIYSISALHRRLLLGLVVLFSVIISPIFAKGPEPPLRLPLENFGFQSLSNELLLNGSSQLTLHYVDDKHLLLTFARHRLLPRLPDEPEDDQDRNIDAVLLELPSGKELARTSWHLHDHAQYLWSLGHGQFLLRIRGILTTFAPMANLAKGKPFSQQPFLISPDRRFAAIIVSPEADMLTIESVKIRPPAARPKTPLFGPTPPAPPEPVERDAVQIAFYRIHPKDDGGAVEPIFAGGVIAQHVGDIPVTTAGYLAVVNQGRQHWAFDFHNYAGKVAELSPFDSNCSPAPIFVSHGEFIAFGCRTAQTMQQIGGFNMRGEEMWEQGLFGDFVAPSLSFAPTGGRFALSRILLRGSAVADQPISSDEVSSQTVVVYQTGTGKQLLRADCSPVERAGQNFTLSPGGSSLAVVHADAIEIYNLPPLTDKDEAAIKMAQSSAPEDAGLPVKFKDRVVSTAAPEADSLVSSGSTADPPAAASDTAPHGVAAQPAVPSPQPMSQPAGDVAPEQRRAPPTLYNLPDDKAPATPKTTPQ